jgi:hypothetical protein
MRPRERRETGEQDLFRSRLDQIIDINHPASARALTPVPPVVPGEADRVAGSPSFRDLQSSHGLRPISLLSELAMEPLQIASRSASNSPIVTPSVPPAP